MKAPIIRVAKERDMRGIAELLKEAYNIDTVEEGVRVFLEETHKKYNFVVAEVDDKIIGIASYQIHGLPKHMLAEMDRIAVSPDFRGKGIAKLLFEFLVKEANDFYRRKGFKLRKIYLMTHEDNKRAQEFYKKMGFQEEAKLKDHFYKGKAELVMSVFFD
ncbi:MAG: GNAT family N-acetyltransferase [Candidatus Aenigmatarchaeota archaeon]